MDDPAFASIAEVAAALTAGALSARVLTESLLGRIATLNGRLGAFTDVIAETALAEATASDARRQAGRRLGPLDGVPIAIKDLIDVTPAHCSSGLPQLTDYRPADDAVAVRRLRAAGAVVLGVTATDAGGCDTRTPAAYNPLARARNTGGSSGGTAAAVAAGLAQAGLGTDTGGSIRIPAACCSIAGFKPSYGRVPLAGCRPLSPSSDHLGPLARSVADCREIAAVLDPQGFAEPLPPLALAGLRFGWAASYWADAQPAVRAAMERLREACLEAGMEEVAVSLPLPDAIMPAHGLIVLAEAAAYHTRHFPDDWPRYPESARETVAIGETMRAVDYLQAFEERATIRAQVDAALAEVDCLLLPSLPMDAPLRDAEEIVLAGRGYPVLLASIRYTAMFDQTGHPAVSLPVASLPDGRALSAQIVGPRDGDARLLALATALESHLALAIDYPGLMTSQGLSATA